MIPPCILCHAKNTNLNQKVGKTSLCKLYKRAFGLDIAHLIQSDLLYWHCPSCDIRFFTLEDGRVPTGDEAFYNQLNKLDWYYQAEKGEYHYARDYISKNTESKPPKILEVGCGRAAFASFLAKTLKHDYVGLEFSASAKRMAADSNIEIQNLSIETYAKCEEAKEGFDVVCSFQVLEHVANPHSFLHAKIQCLKGLASKYGGGRPPSASQNPKSSNQTPLLIVAVPSEDSFLKHSVNNALNLPPHHVSRFSDKALESIATIFNLKLLDIYHEGLDPQHIDWFKETMWAKKFLPTPLINRSFERKLVNKLGRIFGKNLISIPKNTYGHTALAIYTTRG